MRDLEFEEVGLSYKRVVSETPSVSEGDSTEFDSVELNRASVEC